MRVKRLRVEFRVVILRLITVAAQSAKEIQSSIINCVVKP